MNKKNDKSSKVSDTKDLKKKEVKNSTFKKKKKINSDTLKTIVRLVLPAPLVKGHS